MTGSVSAGPQPKVAHPLPSQGAGHRYGLYGLSQPPRRIVALAAPASEAQNAFELALEQELAGRRHVLARSLSLSPSLLLSLFPSSSSLPPSLPLSILTLPAGA